MTREIDRFRTPGAPSLRASASSARRAPRALPRRFRRPRLLIVGCGDVGTRLLGHLAHRLHERLGVVAVTRRLEQRDRLRALGARTLAIDLDDRRAVRRLAALAAWTIHLAPPPAVGDDDPRIARLVAACSPEMRRRQRRAQPPARWVYLSTTGVYGDAGGARFDETRRVAPATARARRRVAAERRIRALVRSGVAHAAILRAPGLYAHDRLPLERLRRRTPVLVEADDVFTNHVHADDLAHALWLALFRARPARVYHAVDDRPMKVGEYLDRVADACGLARAPRLTRDAITAQVSAATMSFLSESRRLVNRRLARELRCRLRWPTVESALAALASAGAARARRCRSL